MRTRKAKDRARLMQAALGQIPCDLTIGNVQFFNVITGEIYPASVDILDGFVVLVREEGQEAILQSRSYYDGQGRYLIPGYIDTHMHIESTMMIPENLARAILPWGTTTVCTDPHEIGNVMGLDGVRFMLENAKKSRLRQYVLAPSCVPSLPGMENAGAEFLAKEVGELLDMDDVIGIAEIMDYVGVIQDSERMHTIIDEGLRRGMFLQGHAPYCSGRELAAYLIGGPVSDHESVNADEVRGKLRAGMHINLRASSLIDNLSFLVDGCKDQPWRDFVSVCTDDVHAKDLLTVGHINNVVRKAVASGLDGREVVKMATLNAAREYGFNDLGAIAPGYIADIQLVDALDGSRPKAVFTEGVLVAEDGKYLGGDCKTADYDLPNTVNMPQITGPESFVLRVPEGYTGDTIRVNVMVSEDGNRILRHVEPVELPVRDGAVDISGDPTLVFVCCANRYGRRQDDRRLSRLRARARRTCVHRLARQPQLHRQLPRSEGRLPCRRDPACMRRRCLRDRWGRGDAHCAPGCRPHEPEALRRGRGRDRGRAGCARCHQRRTAHPAGDRRHGAAGAAERGHYGYGPRQRYKPDVRTRVCGCGSINESANKKG